MPLAEKALNLPSVGPDKQGGDKYEQRSQSNHLFILREKCF
jgi:hypothetical protein